ncbi:CHASE3 domain-containing protein [Peribacillus frigoritolerans]|uniref:CHASE3 domain-containing protein n=1 Tax=Peribacillus frigoritolerans TaxID=450367 RepID=UPI0023DCB453|nr:hypothetical protein [Peribacillus frigoritolerans]MDF1996183.1 hypothetical protein [Peribacillus frigoritolerans]
MKSIKAKVLVAFSLIISLCVILGAFNIYSSNKSLVYSQDIIERELPLLIQDEKHLYNLAQRTAFVRAYILYGDESYKERFLQYTEESQVIQEELLALSDSDKAKELIEKSVDWRTMIVERVFIQYEKGNEERAKEILKNEVAPISNEVLEGFKELASKREELIQVKPSSKAGNRSRRQVSSCPLQQSLSALCWRLLLPTSLPPPSLKLGTG